MLKVLSKIFPSKSEKAIRKILPVVRQINGFFEQYSSLSDEDLRGKTAEFRGRIDEKVGALREEARALREKVKTSAGMGPEEREAAWAEIDEIEKEAAGATAEVLEEILPEAFAAVKEACRRLVGQSFEVMERRITWDMVPFDVQLIGGIILHHGTISEMATGEGKTLVATMPLYLNALPGRGVHLVTVNDYLARRDSEWMGRIFEMLGLTVGCIQAQMDPATRRKQYACDITYGTNNEFGFDYLRDNMVINPDELVHRNFNYAIVDEVDSVLIDEARTPLIISGPVQTDDQRFSEMKPRVERLVSAQRNYVTKILADADAYLTGGEIEKAGIELLRAHRGLPKHKKLIKLFAEPQNKKLMQQTEIEYLRDQSRRMHEIDDELYYAIDERNHQITLTEKGRELLAGGGSDKDFFVLPDIGTGVALIEADESADPAERQRRKDELNQLYADRSDRIHTVTQLLKAYSLYEKDDEYVVTEDGKVMIVDEFTGRLLHGRRYSDGLHQAIEAKEGVKVERDTQTLATITLQNFFRLYSKLAGMTGTAETEAAEFIDIYKLDVDVVPTNRPMVREDLDDLVYRTKREKYNAVIAEIGEMRAKHRPVLVGTTSVEVSETLGRMLKRENIPHNVLNAKQHQREAEIVAHAGLPGGVTIATNMAGRGTDIKLGAGVAEAGGLHIIGTERHEARRIDRQLRGRAGRQGDPGSSQFFLSLEDDLMRLFGSDRIAGIMERLGLKEGDVIQHPMITRSVERAQKKVEENNYAIRKRLLEYDNVMNQQREVIYTKRRHALLGDRLREDIFAMLEDVVSGMVDRAYGEFNLDQLREAMRSNLLVDFTMDQERFHSAGLEGVKAEAFRAATEFYRRKEERIGAQNLAALEKLVSLQVIDEKWRDHLREMDDLREGIHLRAYGQKDPIVEYKTESFNMFVSLLDLIAADTINLVFKMFPQAPGEELRRREQRARRPVTFTHDGAQGMGLRAATAGADSGGDGDEGPHAGHSSQSGRPLGGGRHRHAAKTQPVQVGEKTGRNDPCPCGSGKKFKQCHGR